MSDDIMKWATRLGKDMCTDTHLETEAISELSEPKAASTGLLTPLQKARAALEEAKERTNGLPFSRCLTVWQSPKWHSLLRDLVDHIDGKDSEWR